MGRCRPLRRKQTPALGARRLRPRLLGFYVLSEEAEFVYKCTDYYNPKAEHSLLWNDPAVGIEWPLQGEPKLSPKDLAGKLLNQAVLFD